MEKYVEVFKVGWKEILAYSFDVFGSAVFSIFKILLAFIMWQAIFNSKPDIAGYSFPMMLTYYILVTLMTNLDKSKVISSNLAKEIRSGNFTKYVVKPVHSMTHYIALVLSKFSYVFTFNVTATIVWAVVFSEYFILPQNLGSCMTAILIFMLGMIFLTLLNYFFTILTFWVLEVTAFFMIKDYFIEFSSGAFLPLALLPSSVLAVLKVTPFYYVYYYPISLYLNPNFGGETTAFLTLSSWIVILFVANELLYKIAIKSYDGVGI